MILKDIINIIESVAPLSAQEPWDNSGLQVGNPDADVRAALLTVDVTESVVSEAVSKGCQLIVSHHPLLFRGLKQVCGQTPQARCLQMAIENHIAIYSSHTSMDKYLHGVSGRMAEKIGLSQYHILVPDGNQETCGLGVIGDLSEAIAYDTLLQRIKTQFNATYVRYTRAKNNKVKRIAVCGGAAAEFVDEAIRQQADVYLTADCKYHELLDKVGEIAVVDLDHWVSEQFTRDIFAELLQGHVECHVAQTDQTPVQVM